MKEKKIYKINGDKSITKEEIYSPIRKGITKIKFVLIESKKYKGGHFGYILEWPTFRSPGKSIDGVLKGIFNKVEDALQNKELDRFKFNYDQSARKFLETVYKNDKYRIYPYTFKRDNTNKENKTQNNFQN